MLVAGQMYMSWESGDEESQRMAIAQLYECGRGSRAQLAEAFGVHVNSVQNYITGFARDGFRGIASQRRGPRGGWKLTPRRRSKILAVVFQDGVGSVESVQERLRERWHEEISLPSIRQVLEENGLLDAESLDRNDQGEQGDYNAYAGGLLFVPLLEQYEFLPTLKRVIDIPTSEGYSLDELCLTLLYTDVFGFRSMEDFKRAYPEEFGVLIGRAQSPSVFTLRRFLHKVRELGKSEWLIDEFAVSYLKNGLAQWGVMYIDGHFLPYHGIYPIKKGWHGVRQVPMKGSYNFWAVDEGFRPWLFLIRSSSEDLLQKIPELIEKAKQLGRAAGLSREVVERLIVLFDREGYSAELYRYFEGKDEGAGQRRAIFISWAKYADKWVYDIEEASLDKTVKVFACNLNEAMCRMLLQYYDCRKEILPALSMIVERAGEVKLEDGELRVRLRGFRNPEIDYAARRLCEDLNGMNPRTLDRFRIPLRYEVT